MKIVFHNSFEKQFVKLPNKVRSKVKERILIFETDPYDVILNNHALHGKYVGYRSINITGDLRIIYKQLKNTAIFSKIGTHGKLYS